MYRYYNSNERVKFFFKNLTKAKDFVNGKITFDQGYINENINSGKYNISVLCLPINQFLSGYVMMSYGLYFYEDIVDSIFIFSSYI